MIIYFMGACKVCCGLADKSPSKNTFFLTVVMETKLKHEMRPVEEYNDWMERLKRVGEYHDGFVRNVDDVLAKATIW